MISKTAWFCPHDTVQFVPVTPKSELASKVSEVVEEERKRIYVKVRVVEKAGHFLQAEASQKRYIVQPEMPTERLPLVSHWRRETCYVAPQKWRPV